MSVILNKIKLEAVIHCPLCDKEFRPAKMKIIEHAGDTLLTHSHCPRCEGAILSLLYKDIMGIALIGMVTDLHYEDALKIKNSTPLESDDVLEIYQLMSEKQL